MKGLVPARGRRGSKKQVQRPITCPPYIPQGWERCGNDRYRSVDGAHVNKSPRQVIEIEAENNGEDVLEAVSRWEAKHGAERKKHARRRYQDVHGPLGARLMRHMDGMQVGGLLPDGKAFKKPNVEWYL